MGKLGMQQKLFVLFGCLWALIGSNCNENNITKLPPKNIDNPALVVSPGSINFGVVSPGSTVSEVVTLSNEGGSALDIEDILLEGGAFTAASAAPLGLLGPGEQVEMMISYTPINVIDEGMLTVFSDVAATEEVLVPLQGQAAYPVLEVIPSVLDFGWIEPLTTANESFTLRNAGFADLDITNNGFIVIANEFVQIDSLSLPITLAPGEEDP